MGSSLTLDTQSAHGEHAGRGTWKGKMGGTVGWGGRTYNSQLHSAVSGGGIIRSNTRGVSSIKPWVAVNDPHHLAASRGQYVPGKGLMLTALIFQANWKTKGGVGGGPETGHNFRKTVGARRGMAGASHLEGKGSKVHEKLAVGNHEGGVLDPVAGSSDRGPTTLAGGQVGFSMPRTAAEGPDSSLHSRKEVEGQGVLETCL